MASAPPEVRALTAADREALLGFVRPEPELNLFIIGDVENYGFDHPDVQYWGQFDAVGGLCAVLLRYLHSFVYFGGPDADPSPFFRITDSFEWDVISGERTRIEAFMAHYPGARAKHAFLSKLSEVAPEFQSPAEPLVRSATVADIPAIMDLLAGIEEFAGTIREPRMMAENLERGASRMRVIEEDGRIVSIAQTTAETSQAAMIVGVASRPEVRRRGYASACMARLCRELTAEGKSLCLFYISAEAGRIYQRLGFREIGRWTMLVRQAGD